MGGGIFPAPDKNTSQQSQSDMAGGIACQHGFKAGANMSANNMKAAEQTYHGFLNLIKYSIPVLAVIVILVILLIS